jgi:predicted membrane-bound spermidine synthase
VNLTLAAASLVVERMFDTRAHAAPSPAPEPPEAPAGLRAAMLGLVLSGFTSMLFETGWIRLVTLVVGASTYAFTWIVTAFIFGIALGSFWFSRRKVPPSIGQFGRLQALVALAVSVSLPLYLLAPYLFVRVRVLLAQRVEAFPAYQLVLFGVSLAVMLVPTFFMGAAFPAGARLVARASETAGKRLGLVWAANTIGTVLGALLGGLWLMPTFGLETLFTIGMVLTWIGATVALWVSPGSARRLAPSLLAAASLVLTVWSSSGWASLLARMSPFRAALAAIGTLSFREYVDTSRETVVQDFVRDDTFATVFVGHERLAPTQRFLLVNGKADASTGSGDLVTQTVLGQLGVLLAPRPPKQVMMVGAGSGVSLAGALASNVERVDLVEISPAVLEAARQFGDVNHKALQDPRVHVHLDDARTFLLLEPRAYDVIVSEPSNPWVSGISSLFTKEFFEIVDRRLAPDGVLVQWFHTYEMNDELVKLVLRTLRTRFPNVTGWEGGGGDLVLVASRQPVPIDFQQIAARLEAPGAKALLTPLHIEGVEGVLALEQASSEGLATWAGTGALNSDDKNLLEYRAPVAFFADQAASPPDERRRPSRFGRLELTRYLERNPLDATSAARVHLAVSSGQNEDSPLRRSSAAAWMRLAPDEPTPREAYAKVALEQGDADAAKAALEPMHRDADRQLELRAALADQRRRAAPFRVLPKVELLNSIPAPPNSPSKFPENAPVGLDGGATP